MTTAAAVLSPEFTAKIVELGADVENAGRLADSLRDPLTSAYTMGQFNWLSSRRSQSPRPLDQRMFRAMEALQQATGVRWVHALYHVNVRQPWRVFAGKAAGAASGMHDAIGVSLAECFEQVAREAAAAR